MIVTNLPTYLTEKRLREHFSARGGEITDVRLIRKQDGTSRRVAFLGFKHERDAQTVRDYFDKTYLDTSKLRVDLVTVGTLSYSFVFFLPAHGHNFSLPLQGTKGAPLARPNKRSREKKESAIEGEPKRKKVKIADGQQMLDDRKRSEEDRLEEFTRIMSKKRAKKADWAAEVEVEVEDSDSTNKPKEDGAGDQHSSRANSADLEDASTRGYAEKFISDAEWMRRKMGGFELDEKVFEQSDDENEPTKPETIQVYLFNSFQYNYPILKPCQAQAAEVQEEFSTHDTIMSTSRLFVRNLVFSCTEDDLCRRFEEYGPVDQVRAQDLYQRFA